MYKVCSTCAKCLPLDSFGPRKASRDGLRGECRTCLNLKCRRCNSSSVRKERIRAKHLKYVADHPDKYYAHGVVNSRIQRGLLQRCPCEICGSTDNIRAHHEDYTQPLDIIWLCQRHHRWIHS